MTNELAELKALIAAAGGRARPLKKIRWQLRGPGGEYVGLGPVSEGLPIQFVPKSEAQTFDGRDNEDLKLKFYGRALGPLTVAIVR